MTQQPSSTPPAKQTSTSTPQQPAPRDELDDLVRITTNLVQIDAAEDSRLGSQLRTLQIVANDALAHEDNRTATQWIDFEIVPKR